MLARAGFGPDTTMARDALEIATLGGAKVPNGDAIGALDCDYGLVGEGGDQLDLLVGEWPRLGTCEAKYAGLQLPNPATMHYDSPVPHEWFGKASMQRINVLNIQRISAED